MNRSFVTFLLFCLTAFTQTASASWSDDYLIGDSYSGLMNIGQFGARKHVALPPTSGKWVLVSIDDFSTQVRSQRASFESVRMGRLVYAEVIDEKVVAVLEAKASISANDALWPDMCFASNNQLFRENFPKTRRPTEKCLIIETVAPSAFNDLARSTVVNFSLNPTSKLIQATATIQGRQGFLQIKVTTISDTDFGQSPFVKSYVQWAQRYSELLDLALTHTADEFGKKIAGIPRQLADGSVAEYTDENEKKGAQPHDRIFQSIEKLKEFKDKGILSEEEFKTKRDELLKRL